MMKSVKVVESLTGVSRDGEMSAMPTQKATITDMSNMRWLRLIQLTNFGVTVERVGKVVLIPMSELLKLAEQADPSFICPPELQKGPK